MWRRPAGTYVLRVDIINELILQAVASPWLYLVMFAVAVIDGFFPPVPSETVLVAAAAVAATGGAPADLVLLGAVAAAGAWAGDNIAYAIGRGVGTTRFAWMRGRRAVAAFDWAQRGLLRGGAPLILAARYIPVGRVAVNMSAGALGYRWRRFLLISAVAAVTWSAYSIGIGLVAGHWLEGQPLLAAALGVGFALVLGLIIDRVGARRRRRAARIAPAPAPECRLTESTVAG